MAYNIFRVPGYHTDSGRADIEMKLLRCITEFFQFTWHILLFLLTQKRERKKWQFNSVIKYSKIVMQKLSDKFELEMENGNFFRFKLLQALEPHLSRTLPMQCRGTSHQTWNLWREWHQRGPSVEWQQS